MLFLLYILLYIQPIFDCFEQYELISYIIKNSMICQSSNNYLIHSNNNYLLPDFNQNVLINNYNKSHVNECIEATLASLTRKITKDI